jgi:hypothetical protein
MLANVAARLCRDVCYSYDLLVLISQRGKCASPLSATMNVFVREVTARAGPRGYVGYVAIKRMSICALFRHVLPSRWVQHLDLFRQQ